MGLDEHIYDSEIKWLHHKLYKESLFFHFAHDLEMKNSAESESTYIFKSVDSVDSIFFATNKVIILIYQNEAIYFHFI